jgi:hypothetical protein
MKRKHFVDVSEVSTYVTMCTYNFKKRWHCSPDSLNHYIHNIELHILGIPSLLFSYII